MKNYILLILAVLIISDLTLGILFIKKSKQDVMLSKEYEKIEQDRTTCLHSLQKVYNNLIRLNNNSITDFLYLSGYSLVNNDNSTNQLFFIIPPSPCDACLDRELEYVKIFLKHSDNSVIIITPEYRRREIAIRLESGKNITFWYYNPEQYSFSLDVLIYFKQTNGIITDIFTPEKDHPEYSRDYFQFHFGIN